MRFGECVKPFKTWHTVHLLNGANTGGGAMHAIFVVVCGHQIEVVSQPGRMKRRLVITIIALLCNSLFDFGRQLGYRERLCCSNLL